MSRTSNLNREVDLEATRRSRTRTTSFPVEAGQLLASISLTGRRNDLDGLNAARLVLPLPRHAGPFGSHRPIPGPRSHDSYVRRG